ncbi:hypothetical protein ACP49_13115 [Clostridium botulinum]|nr:hypothetical protein ACP53_08005 [Clostridium botulinum]KON01632.1 hypothetical protein ACP49_13115 [Clostridium botulinum]
MVMKVSYKFVEKYYAHKYWPCKINDSFYLKLLVNFLFPLL